MKKNNVQYIAGIITDTHIKDDNVETVFNVFKQFLDFLIENDIDNAFFLGDWFYDRSGTSILCQIATRMILDEFIKNEIKFHIIPGNHDKRSLTEKYSYLHSYVSSQDLFIKLYDEYAAIDLKDFKIHMIPFFTEGEAYNEQLKKVVYSKYKKDFLFTHIAVNGVRNNDGTIVEAGVPVKALSKFYKVLIGHYHNASTINDDIRYIGSGLQANYGEMIDDKGFSVLTSAGIFIKKRTDFKKYVQVKVNADDKEKVRKLFQNLEHDENQNVRVVFQGSFEQIQSIDKKVLKDAGIDVKFETIIEKDVEELMQKDNISSFTKSDIIKHYFQYTKDNNFTKEQRLSGLALLKNI